MPVAFGCAVPHPPIIIPEVGKDELENVAATVQAMKDVAVEVGKADPDLLVFISPHSPGFADSIAVRANPVLTGSFATFGAPNVELTARNDLGFIDELIRIADGFGLSVTKIGRGHVDILGADELDHGVLVPLYYLRQAIDMPIVSLSISLGEFDEHYTLGMAVQQATDATKRRIAFVASGDLSHRLQPGAPASYNPRGVDFDAKIEAIFDTGYFDELKTLDPSLIRDAGECGLRSIYALAGVCNELNVRTKVLSYEGPFGVGYLVAEVYPGNPSPARDLYTTEVEQLPPTEPGLLEPGVSEPVRLAQYSLTRYFELGHPVTPPDDTSHELINRRAGAFVCLKVNGNLRGCIGTIEPTQANLAEEIMSNALQAAFDDPRFIPVSADELTSLEFTVDILDEPEPIRSIRELDPKIYGVIVQQGYKTGLLLPDIEGVGSAEQQVAIAKQKAGIDIHENTELFRFRVIRYE
ncbi:MAG TPA: AmmeMemoRadiSam system protein A [Candidatus Aquicultor sp.]